MKGAGVIGKRGVKRLVAWPLTRPATFRRARHLGRWVSATAGGDGISSDPVVNGEGYVLEQVVRATRAEPAVIVEVGASRGDYVLLLHALTVGGAAPSLQYHGFEPGSEAFGVLEGRLAAPELAPWTTVNRLAVGAQSGTVTFNRVVGAGSEISSIHPQRVVGTIPFEVVPETVVMTTIDAYVSQAGIAHVLFLKIDAEGNDRDVIAGAQGLLARQAIDFIQFEYNASWIDARSYLRDVFDLLTPAGYALGKIRPDFVECFPQWDYRLEWYEQSNYVAWRPSVAPPFRVVTTERYLTTGR